MKLVLSDKDAITRFTNWVGLLKIINEEMSITATKEGLSSLAMDPSHVAMVDSQLKASAFNEYSVKGEEKVEFNLDELHKRLKTVTGKEVLTIQHDKKSSKLRLMIKDPDTQRLRRFGIQLLEPMEEDVPTPKIFFKGKVEILMKDLSVAVRDAGLVSEHIKLELKKNGENISLAFIAQGDSGDSGMDLDEAKGTIEEDSAATFTLSYLEDFTSALKPLADKVTFEISTDMPLKMATEQMHYDCKLYLAPCIGV